MPICKRCEKMFKKTKGEKRVKLCFDCWKASLRGGKK